MKMSSSFRTLSSVSQSPLGSLPMLVMAPGKVNRSEPHVSSIFRPSVRRVLLVEQDAELCRSVSGYLSTGGFAVEVVHCGLTGLKRAVSGEHAIVIMNVELPDFQGIEILRRVRAVSRTPVLMLTTRDDGQDRILGLEMGADDCLPKPFIPRELFARVEAILRRTMPEDAGSKQNDLRCIAVEDVMLEDHARVALLSGRKLELTTVEYDLLRTLLRSAGQVLSREEMVQMVLGRDFSPLDRSIDTHVSHLRKKMGPRPDGLERIKCVRSVGYQYVVSPGSEDGAA